MLRQGKVDWMSRHGFSVATWVVGCRRMPGRDQDFRSQHGGLPVGSVLGRDMGFVS